ncbi:histidine triad nucleotide-binding protein [Candidatus Peregrinibacteria bacterium]|nr:histidine triad nucleotide-binding protein [Candidatus Peregrinibacteria bacterium]
MTKTLFQKILDKEIPSEFLHEDEFCVAIKDIHPKAPLHLLLITKKPIPSIREIDENDKDMVAHLIYTAKALAERYKCDGYRLQFNVGEKGGQEVFHLHLHLLGWF